MGSRSTFDAIAVFISRAHMVVNPLLVQRLPRLVAPTHESGPKLPSSQRRGGYTLLAASISPHCPVNLCPACPMIANARAASSAESEGCERVRHHVIGLLY